MRKFLFLFLIIGHYIFLHAQEARVDSLKEALSKYERVDTTYINLLNDLAFQLILSDQQQSISYINEALAAAKELNYERGIIRAITLKGNSFLVVGLPDQALSYYLEALSFDVAKYTMDYVGITNNIGEVYRRKKVYDSSIKYFNKALNIAIDRIDGYRPTIIYSNLGEVCLMQEDIEKAKEYFSLCLENALETNDFRAIGYGYHGLAECAFTESNTSRAIDLMRKSIEGRQRADHQRGLMQSYLQLGAYFNADQNTDSTLFYWNKAETLSKQNQANDLLNQAYDNLYSFYLSNREIEKAAEYLEKHKHLGDSLRNAEFISNVDKMKTALKSELVIAENELLKQQQQQKDSEQDAKLIVVVLAFLIVLGLAVTTYQFRKRQKAIFEAEIESTFTRTLLTLSRELNRVDLNLSHFIRELLAISRDVLDCDRASYWVLDAEKQVIYLHTIEQRGGLLKIPPAEFRKEQFPSFLDEFLQNRTLAVSRLSEDSRLTDIYNNYFKPAQIESILNAPILIDGKFVGFISYAMTYNKIRDWDVQEQRYVGSLADLIVAAIAKNRNNVLQKEKEELIQKLRIRNKSLQEFNSVISHNLREPLTQIIGFSELLGNTEQQGVSGEIVEKISDASNRIDRVIKELSIVLNENDPTPADFRFVSLEKVVKEVLDLLKTEIKANHISVVQHFKVKKIKTYRPYLYDAIFHLISNSIKFSVPGKNPQIKIESYQTETHNIIRISDNGRGFDLAKFGDKIFKMYQRYHLDTEGRGIGLFIVKNRVISINGLIEAESEEGVGSSFTIHFQRKSIKVN
ncbi:MAG: tetratricopeptide repeat-containing sensor histidine kinase [Ekhidna sp.]|uniref:tetratricopeptide repeat-containing sensor histidine kinase n=1 Tax=Ekhidna sp. TaxID=2608089 RepID=UPI0032EEE4C6